MWFINALIVVIMVISTINFIGTHHEHGFSRLVDLIAIVLGICFFLYY